MPIAHGGTGGQGSERSESEKRRPDGETRNEPCPKGNYPCRRLGASTLTAKGPVCDKQPVEQEKMTLRVTLHRPRVTLLFPTPSAARRRCDASL